MIGTTVRVIGFVLLGALGMAMYACTAHLWIDHQNLHVLIRLVEQGQKPAPAPTSPPTK